MFNAGDSLFSKREKPNLFIRCLRSWLRKQFGRDFVLKENALRCGKQLEGNCCGVIVANSIAHDSLGDDLWVQANAAIERARWFLRLAELELAERVSQRM